MKKLLLSTVALAAMSAGAMAADLPSRRMAPAPYVAVPVFTWTGFYVGVNAGYGFSDNGNSNGFGIAGLNAVPAAGIAVPVVPFPGQPFNLPSNRNNRDGFVGGGQIGYNYQMGNIVLGVEGDIQYVDFGGGRRNNNTFGTAIPVAGVINGVPPGAPGNVAFFNRGTGGSDFFGSVRGRLGFAMDRTLIYATGGAAFRDTGSNTGSSAFGFNNANHKGNDDVGYVVGGGVEYAFTPNITAKIEGLYVNFSGGNHGTTVGVTNVGVPIVATGINGRGRDDDFAVVRAGLNYKFNGF